MNELEATAVSGNHRLTGGDRRRIAIERDHIGTGRKNGRRIAASTKGAVENDFPGSRLERRKHLGKKNRNVANRSATGIS